MAKQNDPVNRREFTRVPLPFPVELEFEGRSHVFDKGYDVSARGIAVSYEGALEMARGTSCRARIDLAGYTIEFEAVVQRAGNGCIGLEIVSLGFEEYERMRQLVRFNADDPDVVDREFMSHLGLRPKESGQA